MRRSSTIPLALITIVSALAAPGAAQVDSIIDPAALSFARGPFGTIINGQTFQYPAITTSNGWQYATWFDGEHRLCIGRRKLPDGNWQKIAFDDYRIDHNDVHNVTVIGICPLDGTIHLAFDHHGSALHYRVSQPRVTTSPDKIEWSAKLFGPTRSDLVDGQPIRGVTYPEFFNTPDGRLQLYYRLGGSGSGDSWLAEYNPRKNGWAILGAFIDRGGIYQGSKSRNAYHNGFDYAPAPAPGNQGPRLHTTWTWREGLNNGKFGLLNCHGLMYAYSDDFGRTWRDNDGVIVGVSGERPMTIDTSNLTVRDLPYRWGIMNQVTQTVGADGRVHAVMWHQPPDAEAGSRAQASWRYYHYWRDGEHWQGRQLPFVGRKPSVHVDAAGDLWLVFNRGDSAEYHGVDPGGKLTIAKATSAADWSDWRIVWESERQFAGEPRVDAARWSTGGVLSVYVQRLPAAPGAASALHAIDFDPAKLAKETRP